MGDLSLRDAVDALRIARRVLERAEGVQHDLIPGVILGEIVGGSFGDQLSNLLDLMRAYGPRQDNLVQARGQIERQARELKDRVLTLVPYIRTDEQTLQQALDEAASATSTASDAADALVTLRDQVEKQQTALASASASTAATDLSRFYKDQAASHAESAKTFLAVAVVAAVVLTLLTVAFLFVWPPDYDSADTSTQWLEVARHTVSRLVVLSIAGFAVAFCVRNYRVNMHLEVLNKRRENALNTFGLLQAAVTTDDARNIVVGELVQSVFLSEETGYLSGNSDRTIIESPGGAGLISAMTSKGD
ncbi:hypothetical protein GCM10009795_013700 [Nocardioides hankookensis]